MMNVPRDKLSKVLALLPALQRPTISELAEGNWVDVNTILDERKKTGNLACELVLSMLGTSVF